MRIRAGSATDIGKARERNEDAYLTDPPLYAVADGMGGHRGGDVASSLALETLGRAVASGDATSLADAIRQANRAVFERSFTDREVAGMGTTLTAAAEEEGVLRLGHVGDSRAYLLRGATLRRLTEDHTLVGRMVREGRLTEDEAAVHPQRSVLTRALGVEETVRVDQGSVEVRGGDRILLCTDGLTAMVPEDEIQRILERTDDPQETAEALVRSANDAGGLDNITVVVLDVETDGDPPTTGEVKVAGAEAATAGSTRGGGVRFESLRAWLRGIAVVSIAALVVVVALVGVRLYVDRQWYVGVSNGRVAVFHGIPATVAGFELHHMAWETQLPAPEVAHLPFWGKLPEGIPADGESDAASIVQQIKDDLAQAQAKAQPQEAKAG